MANQPVTELDARYSSDGATAVQWPRAEAQLKQAQIYWASARASSPRPGGASIPSKPGTGRGSPAPGGLGFRRPT
jgi:hypothetical protein